MTDDSNLKAVLGLIFVAVFVTGFTIAFNTPTKDYLPSETISNIAEQSRGFVSSARPDIIGSAFFIISTFWSMLTTIFEFVVIGAPSLVFDIGTFYGFPSTMLSIIVGAIIIVGAYVALTKLRGTQT